MKVNIQLEVAGRKLLDTLGDPAEGSDPAADQEAHNNHHQYGKDNDASDQQDQLLNDGGKDFRVIRRDLDHPAGAVAQGDRYSDGKAGITGLRVDDILPDYRYAVAVIFPAFLGFHLFEGFGYRR